jgi:hypothetical protein
MREPDVGDDVSDDQRLCSVEIVLGAEREHLCAERTNRLHPYARSFREHRHGDHFAKFQRRSFHRGFVAAEIIIGGAPTLHHARVNPITKALENP